MSSSIFVLGGRDASGALQLKLRKLILFCSTRRRRCIRSATLARPAPEYSLAAAADAFAAHAVLSPRLRRTLRGHGSRSSCVTSANAGASAATQVGRVLHGANFPEFGGTARLVADCPGNCGSRSRSDCKPFCCPLQSREESSAMTYGYSGIALPSQGGRD